MAFSSPLAGLTASALHRRRSEVLLAAEQAPDARSMLSAANAALTRYVPSNAAGWSVADPGTLMPTWPLHIENAAYDDSTRYWEREFLADGYILFRELASRAVPVGRLHAETSGVPARSVRYREFMAPRGFGDGLRAVLRVSGSSWGMVEMLRNDGEPPFSAVEASFVGGLVEPLARILRAKVIRTPSELRAAGDTPGLLLFDSDGVLTSLNDSAASWLQEMPNELNDPGNLPDPVSAVLSYARAVAAGRQRGPARLRVRGRSGRWVVLDASCLSGLDGSVSETAVVIERATTAEVAPLVVAAYELSAREQETIRLLAQGKSTAEIATQLHLSVHTVRDHIKAVFSKVGVVSRGELVARLFTERYQRPLADATQALARRD